MELFVGLFYVSDLSIKFINQLDKSRGKYTVPLGPLQKNMAQASSYWLLRCLLIDFCLHPSSSLIIPSHGFLYIHTETCDLTQKPLFFFFFFLYSCCYQFLSKNSLFSPFMHPLKQIIFSFRAEK